MECRAAAAWPVRAPLAKEDRGGSKAAAAHFWALRGAKEERPMAPEREAPAGLGA